MPDDIAEKIKDMTSEIGGLLSAGMWIPFIFKAAQESMSINPWGTAGAVLLSLAFAYLFSWLGVGIFIGMTVLGLGI